MDFSGTETLNLSLVKSLRTKTKNSEDWESNFF